MFGADLNDCHFQQNHDNHASNYGKRHMFHESEIETEKIKNINETWSANCGYDKLKLFLAKSLFESL